jgi:hypothetical protein
MLKISIPTPCHQDWSAMTPNEQGRHCTSCAKTVIDFTGMTDDEVKYFFINKKEEKVCGRFKNGQLHRIVIELPHNIFYIPMPGWKKFLVASLLVFSTALFSCDTNIQGKAKIEPELQSAILGGSTSDINQVKPPIDTITQTITCTSTMGFTIPTVVGKIKTPSPNDLILTGDTVIQYTTTGTPAIINVPEKMGEIEIPKTDSLKTQKTPEADSASCETKLYY